MQDKLKDLWRKFKAWKMAIEVKFILWKVDRNIKSYYNKQKKLQKK